MAEKTPLLIVMERTGELSSDLSLIVVLHNALGLNTSYIVRNSYMSGSNLLNSHGEPCNLKHGSDDCEPGLVCIQNRNDITRGTCSAFWDDATW